MAATDEWTGTAFLTDREAKYSTSWQSDRCEVTHDHGMVTVEMFMGTERRAYFVLPAAALAPPEEDMDFG